MWMFFINKLRRLTGSDSIKIDSGDHKSTLFMIVLYR
jgi:hypothetical protein